MFTKHLVERKLLVSCCLQATLDCNNLCLKIEEGVALLPEALGILTRCVRGYSTQYISRPQSPEHFICTATSDITAFLQGEVHRLIRSTVYIPTFRCKAYTQMWCVPELQPCLNRPGLQLTSRRFLTARTEVWAKTAAQSSVGSRLSTEC
jgi:hypothetical protein